MSLPRINTANEISAILRSRLDLIADVQVIPVTGERRTLYQLEHIPFSRRMTLAGLERLCRRIAKALDAELYGTINVDFGSLGDSPSFDLLLEVYQQASELHRQAQCSLRCRCQDGR